MGNTLVIMTPAVQSDIMSLINTQEHLYFQKVFKKRSSCKTMWRKLKLWTWIVWFRKCGSRAHLWWAPSATNPTVAVITSFTVRTYARIWDFSFVPLTSQFVFEALCICVGVCYHVHARKCEFTEEMKLKCIVVFFSLWSCVITGVTHKQFWRCVQ